MRFFCLLLITLLVGCAAQPPLQDFPIDYQYTYAQYVKYPSDFRVSPENKYAIVLSGQVFALRGGEGRVSSQADLQKQEPIEDEFVITDADQITRLLTYKKFDTYSISFKTGSLEDFYTLLRKIGKVSNENTQIFITYSGEGDGQGLRVCSLRINPSQLLIVPYTTLTPVDFYSRLAEIKGKFAVLINACQSGIFADAAPSNFRGVVMTACDKNSVTTPYEPYGTTAVFGAFLEQYQDPDFTQDLTQIELELGDWYYNTMHKLFITPKPGLKVSYDPQIFRPKLTSFPF